MSWGCVSPSPPDTKMRKTKKQKKRRASRHGPAHQQQNKKTQRFTLTQVTQNPTHITLRNRYRRPTAAVQALFHLCCALPFFPLRLPSSASVWQICLILFTHQLAGRRLCNSRRQLCLPFFPPSAFLRRLRFGGKSRQAQHS